MITKRSRVRDAIAHEDVDKVPWQMSLTDPIRVKVEKYYGDARLEDPAFFNEWVGNHFRNVEPKSLGLFHGLEEEESPGLWRDGWDIVWDTRGLYGEGEWGRPVNCVLKEPLLDDFKFPEPPSKAAFSHYPQFAEDNKDYFILADEAHLFETAWALRGMQNLIVDMYRNPEFVEDLMDGVTEYYLALIEQMLKYDIDAVSFGDDWGYRDGLLMGVKNWRRFIKPRMARMFALVKEAGKTTYLHSDGNVTAIFPDLIEIGLDVYNPFQPEIMDVYEIKKKHGDRLSFHGGIGIQNLLPFGSPEEVKETVHRMIREVGAGGGYILGPSHSILADSPLENVIALIETVKNQ
jgi:uroporphyrinogen decarboxylase